LPISHVMIMKDTEGKPVKEGDKKSESRLAPVAQPDRNLVPYDPLQMYLLEIKRYNLLTREEEIELGKSSSDSHFIKSEYSSSKSGICSLSHFLILLVIFSWIWRTLSRDI